MVAGRRFRGLGWGAVFGVAVVVVWLAVWLFVSRDRSGAKPAASAAIVVTTTQVRQEDVPIYRSGVGTVVATQSVTVRARIDGQLEKVGFREGQDVKAGQMIALLDPRVLEAQLQQAQAQKAKDAAQLANARVDLARYEALMRQDATPRQVLDTQKALVRQLEAAVQFDDAQISAARTQLGFTEITAPISGRIGARLVDPGNIVHVADANGLAVINQIDPISVTFSLPEDAVPQINRAMASSPEPLAVELRGRDGSGGVLAKGRLVLVNNQIDTTTGTVLLKAEFANPDHRLWPGQYVDARLIFGRRAGALIVPSPVVQRGAQGNYVYVVDERDQVRLQPVVSGGVQDNVAVIVQGLAEGERVVLDGQYKLRPGSKVVEVAARQASPAQGPESDQ